MNDWSGMLAAWLVFFALYLLAALVVGVARQTMLRRRRVHVHRERRWKFGR